MSIKYSTADVVHSYEQATYERKATLIILLVNAIRIGQGQVDSGPTANVALLDDNVCHEQFVKDTTRKKQHPNLIESTVNGTYSLSSSGLLFFGSTHQSDYFSFQAKIFVSCCNHMFHLPTVKVCSKFKWNQPISLEIMQIMYLIASWLWMRKWQNGRPC